MNPGSISIALALSLAACKGDASKASGSGTETVAAAPAPTSDADCLKTAGCKAGMSTATCYFSAVRKACVDSNCRDYGRCNFKTKVTSLDADKQGKVDVESTRVGVVGTDADCKASTGCRDAGNCWARAEDCGPKSDADCKASAFCKSTHACTYDAQTGNCLATWTDEECAASPACVTAGVCKAAVGNKTCVVKDPAVCKTTEVCKTDGRCTYDPATLSCGIGPDDCRRTEGCAKLGKCSKGQFGCAALKNEDCKKAEICKKEGKCKVELVAHSSEGCLK